MILDRIETFLSDCIANEDGTTAATTPETSPDEEAFNRLALDLFAHQYDARPLYRRLCEIRQVEPAAIDHWSRIPAAPADLFKEKWPAEAAPDAVTFLSSGTTQGSDRRSRHTVSARSLALYRRSSLAHFRSMVLPDSPGRLSVLVLGPTSATHPTSSLGHMYGFVAEAFGAQQTESPRSPFQPFAGDGALDVDAAIAWLEEAAASTRPVLILALSSTITAVFERLRTRGMALRLPADSRLVDTGGAKGGRTMSRGGILKAAWRFLHIPAYLCIGEYGMTELLSQFYDDAWHSRWSGSLQARRKAGPSWTRTLVVDPATLEPVPEGERGILRHVDLAGAESIAAVQTLDLGVARGRGFEVLGRASGAETRGCSQLMSVLGSL